jgi:peptidoglycan/xylan/chitin deacetylase (PgdA/CDA1 family)
MFHPTLIILLYHNFLKRTECGTWQSVLSDYMTTYDEFDRQLQILLQQHDQVAFIRPPDFFRLPYNLQNKLYFHLTFDDGYHSILPVLEILKDKGIPASIFVNSGPVGSCELAWPEKLVCFFHFMDGKQIRIRLGDKSWILEATASNDRRAHAFLEIRRLSKQMPTRAREEFLDALYAEYKFSLHSVAKTCFYQQLKLLDWEEIVRISDDGFEIGGHSLTHPILTRCCPDRIISEVTLDKSNIERHICKPVTEFAIPNGQPNDYNALVLDSCNRAGYQIVYSAFGGLNALQPQGLPLKRCNAGGLQHDFASLLQHVVETSKLSYKKDS